MISLFVFDLDGTLVDSLRDLAESANAVLEQCGCPPHGEEAIGRMVGDGAAMLVARAFAAANCPAPADALDRFLKVYNHRLLRFTRPYEGIPDTLDALAGRGTLAVLTNKPLEATLTILEGLKLSSYFGNRVLGGDGPLPRKPDASGFVQLMARAGVTPAQSMMVGDSVIDFRTARNAGVQVCMARYGFGFHNFPLEHLTPADLVIDHPVDLLSSL
jgi:phosphoglycolate phosphatase